LGGNQISSFERRDLVGLEDLQYLDLAANQLRAINGGTFEDLNRLQALDLSYNQIATINRGIFQGLASLEWLFLGSNPVTSIENGAFHGLDELLTLDLGRLPDLHELNLSEATFGRLIPCGAHIEGYSQGICVDSERITSLVLNDATLNIGSFDAIIGETSSIETASLVGLRFSDADPNDLSILLAIPTLNHVRVDGALYDRYVDEFDAFAALSGNTVTVVPEPAGTIILFGILGIVAACRVKIRSAPLLVVSCLACVLSPLETLAVPSYKIATMGLTGPKYTGADGDVNAGAGELNDRGFVVGNSDIFDGDGHGLGNNAWLYDGTTTVEIGLTGAEFTSSDGSENIRAYDRLNESGQTIGYSSRYSGVSRLGQSAWLYDGSATIDISRTGTEYIRSDGYRYSNPVLLNETGQVAGQSARYNGGSTELGQSAWLYDGATTIEIGLTGAEYTRDDGYRVSRASRLNEAGQVSGYSERFDGSRNLGSSAWLFDGKTTIEVGLTGTEFTRSDGFRYDNDEGSFDLNQAGQVAGLSGRYGGGTQWLGWGAWLYDGAKTVEVGLSGTEHTRDDGFRDSRFLLGPGSYPMAVVNAKGQTVGSSDRYNGGSTYLGSSAWLYDGASTIEIGLTGPEHTRSDGFRFSDVCCGPDQPLNDAGYVIGHSNRYEGGESLGDSAWLYNGTTTIELGLTGPEHTRSDGYKGSSAHAVNDAGQVIGSSLRYEGTSEMGLSAWFYDGARTIEIGLSGPEYTRSDGFQEITPQYWSQSGQVVGTSYRYDSDTRKTRDIWFYDPTLNQTFLLRFPGMDDVTYELQYVGEDGLVLGSYGQYAGGAYVGSHAFSFTIADGLHELNSLVAGGLTANGWSNLAFPIIANRAGQILGRGFTVSGDYQPFLLTPIIPEPSSIVLAALTSLTLLQRRRKRTATT
jgi:hypothetical protein